MVKNGFYLGASQKKWIQIKYLYQWFSTRDSVASQEIIHNNWRHFQFSWLGVFRGCRRVPQGGEGHGEEDEGGMQGNFWHLIGRAPRMLHKTKGFLAQNISSAKVENPNVQHHA